MLYDDPFTEAKLNLVKKIYQARDNAKGPWYIIWSFIGFAFIVRLLSSGGDWYRVVILIVIALVFGSAYSYSVSKKLEKETGLTIEGQEAVLHRRDPFEGQHFSKENHDKYIKWLENNNTEKIVIED